MMAVPLVYGRLAVRSDYTCMTGNTSRSSSVGTRSVSLHVTVGATTSTPTAITFRVPGVPWTVNHVSRLPGWVAAFKVDKTFGIRTVNASRPAPVGPRTVTVYVAIGAAPRTMTTGTLRGTGLPKTTFTVPVLSGK